MKRLCMFCGTTGNRSECADGADRCAECIERQRRAAAWGLLRALLAAVGLPPPTQKGLARLTVNVERSKSGSIGQASVTT